MTGHAPHPPDPRADRPYELVIGIYNRAPSRVSEYAHRPLHGHAGSRDPGKLRSLAERQLRRTYADGTREAKIAYCVSAHWRDDGGGPRPLASGSIEVEPEPEPTPEVP